MKASVLEGVPGAWTWPGSVAPTSAVLTLLDAFPAAAQTKTADAKEGLPLHLAASRGASATVCRALLRAFPTAAARSCGSVGLPIHAAVEPHGAARPWYTRDPREALEIVEALLQVTPCPPMADTTLAYG